MKKRTIKSLLAVGVLLLSSAITSCSSGGSGSLDLSGAGATFPLPFYNVIFEEYGAVKGDRVAYGGIGSGGGVRSLRDGIVDFAGSDAYLSEEEMSEMAPVVHVPTCMGAVVLAYNLPNIESLNLSGEIVADIYMGKITKWNDKRIADINSGVALPDADIIPTFRSDGSGTTFVFTDYLTKVSTEWDKNYGVGKSVNFPKGQAAKGNPGVAGVISQTPYSIGYVGSEYAFAQKIPYATLQNANGEFVAPTSESISLAASGEIPADTRTMITNSIAAGAYPISCFTWILIYKEQNYSDRSQEQAMGTLDFLKYILSDESQAITADVHYAPLPQKAIEKSIENLKTVTFNGIPLLQ